MIEDILFGEENGRSNINFLFCKVRLILVVNCFLMLKIKGWFKLKCLRDVKELSNK